MLLSYRFSELESIKLNQLFNNQNAKLVVTEAYGNTMWGIISMTTVRVDVINEATGKKMSKSQWDNETLKLVAQKKSEHQPSFFQRGGKLILIVVIILSVLGYVFAQMVFDHKKTGTDAVENYAKAYDKEIQASWINSLVEGDFVLANKEYSDPVQVYRVKSFTDSTVVLEALDQFIPLGEYEELDKLNNLTLGHTTVLEEVVMERKSFRDGILYDLSVDSSLSNKYIKQIKKK
ncbi:hypothetical protein [Dysgonomonas sp. ZJ279]|uniref:hypothetical protein n=1 Tax=Dysgonomonas sp. ZJ279 TaxID=2709796 RepID=UPI0013EBB9E2|nr:hypothetical protein [Dysgonomonas sp. ZJ279]